MGFGLAMQSADYPGGGYGTELLDENGNFMHDPTYEFRVCALFTVEYCDGNSDFNWYGLVSDEVYTCLLYTSPSPRD